VVHLPDIVRQAAANTRQRIKQVNSNAGNYSEDNLTFMEGNNIEAFIPPDRVKHSEWREAQAPRGRIPKNASRKYLMRRTLTAKRGRSRYKLRQISVEPVFGFIKKQLRLRHFLLRGLEKVRNYWRFTCSVANFINISDTVGKIDWLNPLLCHLRGDYSINH